MKGSQNYIFDDEDIYNYSDDNDQEISFIFSSPAPSSIMKTEEEEQLHEAFCLLPMKFLPKTASTDSLLMLDGATAEEVGANPTTTPSSSNDDLLFQQTFAETQQQDEQDQEAAVVSDDSTGTVNSSEEDMLVTEKSQEQEHKDEEQQQEQDSNGNFSSSLLPCDFEPSPYSVIFGRGKRCTESVGNRRLKVIASTFLGRYAKASNREDKSKVVSEIQSIVQAACGSNPRGAFVRKCERQEEEQGDSGSSSSGAGTTRWIEVEDPMIRDKIGQVLRDCLHTKYRSSVKHKVVKRRNLRNAAKHKRRESSLTSPTPTFSSSSIPTKHRDGTATITSENTCGRGSSWNPAFTSGYSPTPMSLSSMYHRASSGLAIAAPLTGAVHGGLRNPFGPRRDHCEPYYQRRMGCWSFAAQLPPPAYMSYHHA